MKKQLIYIATISTILLQACKKGDDVKPDNTIIHKEINHLMDYGNPFYLDVDNDNADDFHFFAVEGDDGEQNKVYLTVYFEIGSGNKIVVRTEPVEDDWGFWAKALNKDIEIGATTPEGSNWNNNLTTAFLLISETVNGENDMYGPWHGKQNAYLGVQFKKNGKTHYGWVRMSHFAGKAQVLISDYAYNTIPEQPLKAGQF